ncbi:hypothetical protein CEQ90_07515 [Lewinellaceae bacterium SD302]|nr:hypothetical protein CEQ90_07515 [Lewinellaceae bacterium SD302]
MDTDQDRLNLRPEVITQPTDQPVEHYQNKTLRPVLKLQHTLLHSITDHYLRKRKVDFNQTAKDKRRDKLKEMLTRDNRFRSLLFGIVIGQFTTDEMTFYLAQEAAVNRRITNLLHERLVSIYA